MCEVMLALIPCGEAGGGSERGRGGEVEDERKDGNYGINEA